MSTNATPYRHHTTLAAWVQVAAATLLLAHAAPAHADPDPDQKREAAALFRQGKTAYDLGNFEEAIHHFKEAYSLAPHEAFLYNIAQSYRQDGDCQNALFFYKRYVTVGGEEARHYNVVQRRIQELTESCKVIDEMKNEPPLDSLDPEQEDPGGGGQVAPGTGDGAASAPQSSRGDGEDTPAPGIAGRAWGAPSMLTGAIEIGPAFLDAGKLDVVGAQFSLGAGAGYPLEFGKLGLSFGAVVTYTPVPWSNQELRKSGTSTLSGALVNVGVRYRVLDKLALRGELGGGVLFLTGLSEGSVFVPPDTMADGVVGLLNARVGIGAEYMLTENLMLSASPLVFSYSKGNERLAEGVDAFARFELMAGIGYRL